MAKTERLRALSRIDYNGGVYCPGTEEDTFDCDLKEAKRLKDLGVAIPAPSGPSAAPRPIETALAAQAQADLLAEIAAAASEEELAALMPDEEPEDADFAAQLSAAAEARIAELRG